ncbi:hypothetical protein KM043_014967 [Ampulex compressa]|nr:hypothetical protein KM043_014967 [Ampulex compressa]
MEPRERDKRTLKEAAAVVAEEGISSSWPPCWPAWRLVGRTEPEDLEGLPGRHHRHSVRHTAFSVDARTEQRGADLADENTSRKPRVKTEQPKRAESPLSEGPPKNLSRPSPIIFPPSSNQPSLPTQNKSISRLNPFPRNDPETSASRALAIYETSGIQKIDPGKTGGFMSPSPPPFAAVRTVRHSPPRASSPRHPTLLRQQQQQRYTSAHDIRGDRIL